jgi:hypothetical protein
VISGAVTVGTSRIGGGSSRFPWEGTEARWGRLGLRLALRLETVWLIVCQGNSMNRRNSSLPRQRTAQSQSQSQSQLSTEPCLWKQHDGRPAGSSYPDGAQKIQRGALFPSWPRRAHEGPPLPAIPRDYSNRNEFPSSSLSISRPRRPARSQRSQTQQSMSTRPPPPSPPQYSVA